MSSGERPPAVVEVDHTLLQRLRREAVRRDTPVNSLIRDLLSVIVADRLTAALLDE
jgi:hypothetical protein